MAVRDIIVPPKSGTYNDEVSRFHRQICDEINTQHSDHWDDLRVEAFNARTGAVSPVVDNGFAGIATLSCLNFRHTTADEIQFRVQFPHTWKAGTGLKPHCHISAYAGHPPIGSKCRFVLKYTWANANTLFPPVESTYNMDYTFTANQQFVHVIASNASELIDTTKQISSIMACRIYRDNTIADNYAGKISMGYFDIHFRVDSRGSIQEYIK